MNFAHLDMAWLFFIIPLLFVLWWLESRRRERILLAFADREVLAALCPEISSGRGKFIRRGVFQLILGVLLIFTLLRPQWGFIWKESKRKGVDLVLAIDVSESMLARDVRPSRLERAKHEVLDLLEELRGDRIALVAFAGIAFIESPLTIDYTTFRSFLKQLSPEVIPIQGTNIEAALEKGIQALTGSREREGQNHTARGKAIVLITDGESFDGDLKSIAKQAEEQRIRIYVMGIGSIDGAPIPTSDGYKKDRNGNIIVTRLVPKVLEQLAVETGGIFVTGITSDEDTRAIYQLGIKQVLQDTTREGERAKRWNEYFQLPLALAILLIIVPATRPLTNVLRKKSPFPSTLLLLILILGQTPQVFAQETEVIGKQAKGAFEEGNFERALSQFQEAAAKQPEDLRFRIGIGSSYYRLGKFQEAHASFLEAITKAKSPNEKAQVFYNAGNSLVQIGKFEDAIKAYEESLKHVPNDKEAIDNLAYAKRLLQEQKKKENDKKDQEKNKQEKQNGERNQGQENSSASTSQQSQQNQSNSSSPANKNRSSGNQQDSSQNNDQMKNEQNQSQNSQSSQETAQEAQNQEQENASSQTSSAAKENQTEQLSGTSPDQSKSESLPNDTSSSLLDNIEEERDAYLQYRKLKALHDLKNNQAELPEKDW